MYECQYPKLKLYIETQTRKIMRNSNIAVMLNTTATPELVSSLEPDAVIAALGARPAVPTYLPGYDRANVMSSSASCFSHSLMGRNTILPSLNEF